MKEFFNLLFLRVNKNSTKIKKKNLRTILLGFRPWLRLKLINLICTNYIISQQPHRFV